MKKIFEIAALGLALAANNNLYSNGYGRPRIGDKPSKNDKCKDCIKFRKECICSNPNLPPCSGFRKYL